MVKKQKLTPWFPGSVKPVHVGVYETRVFSGAYQFWNGEFWGGFSSSRGTAKRSRYLRSIFQRGHWRGLAEKP